MLVRAPTVNQRSELNMYPGDWTGKLGIHNYDFTNGTIVNCD